MFMYLIPLVKLLFRLMLIHFEIDEHTHHGRIQSLHSFNHYYSFDTRYCT